MATVYMWIIFMMNNLCPWKLQLLSVDLRPRFKKHQLLYCLMLTTSDIPTRPYSPITLASKRERLIIDIKQDCLMQGHCNHKYGQVWWNAVQFHTKNPPKLCETKTNKSHHYQESKNQYKYWTDSEKCDRIHYSKSDHSINLRSNVTWNTVMMRQFLSIIRLLLYSGEDPTDNNPDYY